MPVVSVMNYKGGVGKTTLSANIGGDLARRGRQVLLIDLDPQTNLTLSFYDPADWEADLADGRTIKDWFGTPVDEGDGDRLAALITTPPTVNNRLGDRGGRLDLISSHLDLLNLDLELAAEIGGSTFRQARDNYLKIHRRLANALTHEAFQSYDVILIDCPPNYNVTTKAAIVASDYLLSPAKADYLSTIGIEYLVGKTRELVSEHNKYAGDGGTAPLIEEPTQAVVFTMIKTYGGGPTAVLRTYMEYVRKQDIPTFRRTLRDSYATFADAPDMNVPPSVSGDGHPEVVDELHRLTDEFETWIREGRR
jgi:chromosome partitioning protein